MSLICSLTGKCPTHPVVSPQGYLFEKSAIVDLLQSNSQRCPFSGEALDVRDLKKVEASKSFPDPMRPGGAIPRMIQGFDAELIGLLFEKAENERELKETRKEVEELLLRIDAAKNVIAKLL